MFYVIITSNVVIVMTQKFRLLLSVVFSIHNKMDGQGDAPEKGANFLSNRDLRAMMFYDFMQGKSFQESSEILTRCFGDQAPSRSMVYKWFKEFQFGRRSLEDSDRHGRPISVTTDGNVNDVKTLIKENPRITEDEIKDTLNLSSGSLDRILRCHLCVRKRCARWVPHQLTEEQKRGRIDWCLYMLRKFDGGRSDRVSNIVTGDETYVYQYDPETKQQSSVWLFPGETPPVKFKRSRSVSKQMIAVFFAKSGHVATVPLLERKTVNAEWYINTCLPKVFEAWSARRPRTGTRHLLLHHDNASAHTAAATLDFLQENQVQLVTHPPYSPDLAPCDFFLFPLVKKELKGKAFETVEDARAFVEGQISGIPKSVWAGAVASWFRRMESCIQANGGYFEKLS